MSSAYRIINALSFSLIFIGYFLFPWKINQGIALVGLGLISWAIFNLRSENITKWLSDPLTKLILAFLLICIFQTINTPEIWSTSASDSISRYYKYIFSILAIAAMNDSRDWGKEFIKHLTENRDYAVDFINNNIPQLHAYRPKATYLLYLDIKDLNCTAVELVDFLKKEVKLSVVPGGHNYFGDQSEGHVRICIATSKGILHE